MGAERFHILARDLRAAAIGRCGPPGISPFSVRSLGGRVNALADFLPPSLADEVVDRANRLAGEGAGLTPEQTVALAEWLEGMAGHSHQSPIARLRGATGGGDAA